MARKPKPTSIGAHDMPMSPAERRAVARAVKIASAGAKPKKPVTRYPGQIKMAGVGGPPSLLTKTARNILDAATNTPAGLYQIGSALVHDEVASLKGDPNAGSHTLGVAKGIARSTKQTVEHPLRRPGDTLLLGLGTFGGAAGLASRGAGAAAALKAGEGIGRALARPGFEGGSLLSRPTPGVRTHRVGGLEVRGRYSASPGIRAIQKAKDRTVEKVAHTPAGEAYQIRKAGKELGQNRVVAEANMRAPARKLAHMGRKLSKPQQQALRVWGQGLTVDEKIGQYQQALAELHDAELPKHVKADRAKALANKIALTEAARPYLKGSSLAEFPKQRGAASSKHMQAVARQTERVAGDMPGGRERVLLDAGILEPEQVTFRLHAPGRIALGADWTTAAEDALRRLNQIEKDRQALRPGQTRVPGKIVETRRPRTREEAQAQLGALDEAVQPLVDQIALSLKQADDAAIESLPKRARSRADWIESQHKPKSAETGLAPEDQAAWELENFGTTYQDYLFSKGARQRRTAAEYAADAEEILHQLAGGTPNHEVPLETLTAWATELQAQGIDRAKLARAIGERDDLRGKLGDNRSIDEIFGTEAEASGPVTWSPRQTYGGIWKQKSTDGKYELSGLTTDSDVHLSDEYGRAISSYDSLEAAKAGAQKNRDLLSGKAEQPAATPADYGHVVSRTREPDQIIPGELDDAGVQAMAALDRAEVAAFEDLARGNEPKLVGHEDFKGGRVRIPDVPEKLPSQPILGRGSVYRGGQPRAPKSVTEGYSGSLEQSGQFRVNTTAETARSALEAGKYRNLLDLRSKVLRSGVRARPADSKLVQWVPVREQRLTAKQRRMLAQAQPPVHSEASLTVTEAERARVAGTQWEKFLEDVFPQGQYAHVGVGEIVPNVLWVPRQLLANMNKPFSHTPFAAGVAAIDTALNLVKFGIIPLKTAYVTANAVGNLAFNLFQQGVLLPRNWKQAAALLRDERTASHVREVMGSGGIQSLVAGNPKGLGALNQAMHAYGNTMSELMLEPMMRVSSFVHEAHRFGFKTNNQIHRLLTDPKHADDLAEIARRGKDAIIDYERMGPLERSVVRRALFIYPWVKGATLYGLHFLMEHPVQSGVYSQVAQVGREQAQQDLGDLPSYARGSFKVGGTRDFPLAVNPSTISPFSQAADIGQVALGSLTGQGGSADQLGGLLHPGIQAAIEAAFKRDTFTGAPLQGSFPGLLLQRALGQTAPAVLKSNLDKAGRPPGKRAFPMTKNQVLLRMGVGSFAPRTYNRKVLNDAARQEKEQNLSPGQRARRSVFRERQTIFQTMKARNPELLQDGRLPAPVRKAFNRKADVESVRRVARSRARGDSLAYYRDVAYQEARLLEKWGKLPKGSAASIRRKVATLELEAVRSGVEKMRNDLMPGSYRDITSAGSRYLERSAAPPS